GRALALEGTTAREHLIKNHAEGEDVAAGVGFPALHLFRRHVTQGAYDRPGLRDCRDGGFVFSRDRCNLSQSEVQNFDARLSHHDVPRFQIPVNDPLAMSSIECSGYLDGY